MTQTHINYQALAEAIKVKRSSDRLTMGEAALNAGVSKATISRIEGGYDYKMTWGETFAKLCAWLEKSGDEFTVETQESSTLGKIDRALNLDPTLDQASASVLSGMMRKAYQAVARGA